MQRKSTDTTRGINAEERRFIKWIKAQPCIIPGCGDEYCKVDHVYGSTEKHQKQLIGPWCLLSLCGYHEGIKTRYGKGKFMLKYGSAAKMILQSIENSRCNAPELVIAAIEDYSKDETRRYE